jgi:hypothetical protein
MSQLWIQLLLGGCLTGGAIAFQSLCIGLAWRWRPHIARRIVRMPLASMILVISTVALWMLTGQMLGVWLWALMLIEVGAFETLEPALYFTLAAYTTLGFGDLLPPDDWRLMGAVIGANGMIGFGLATAALVEFVRGIRPGPGR